MIRIVNKSDCCGCGTCVQVCPIQCISFNEDRFGFRYPKVNEKKCIECKQCEKICPILNQNKPQKPLNVFAAKNQNDHIRLKSSSGGLFSLFVEYILDKQGVVFGASFDKEWEVYHTYIEKKEDIYRLRGSKYVQSRIENSFAEVLYFLRAGRIVLFSGTPCQVAGLKRFLKREYENLYTIDIVCHGVPSPLVWREYLKFSVAKCNVSSNIIDISFRNKKSGWKTNNFSMTIESIHGKKISIDQKIVDNPFMQSFIYNLCLRESCFKCAAKGGRSGSDITLGDYWGIEVCHPDWDDNKGTSLVLINNKQGRRLFQRIKGVLYVETAYNEALKGNPCIENSVSKNKYVSVFWDQFMISGWENIDGIICKLKPTLIKRLISFSRRFIKNIVTI